jgi:hypothetical protein
MLAHRQPGLGLLPGVDVDRGARTTYLRARPTGVHCVAQDMRPATGQGGRQRDDVQLALGVGLCRIPKPFRPVEVIQRALPTAMQHVLTKAIERDDATTKVTSISGGTFAELFSVPVLLLCFAYLGLVVSLVTNSTWVPQIVRAVQPTAHFAVIGIIAPIPAIAAILLMIQWGKHSDRTNERRWHVALPMFIAAVGWLMVALLETPVARLIGLVFCAAGTFSAQGIFWTLPASFLSSKARPIGIAMVNTVGMLGTTVGPIVVGWLRDETGTFTASLIFVACCVVAGAISILIIPLRSRSLLDVASSVTSMKNSNARIAR